MMKQETWLADAVEDFLRDCAVADVVDWHNPILTAEFDQLEAMVEDMFIYERSAIEEAIENSYEARYSYEDRYLDEDDPWL